MGEEPEPEKAVRFSLLGPVRAWRAEEELQLGPRQQRMLLAALLAAAGRPVSVKELVDLLWEGDPPASAVNSIHRYVGAVRRLLEPGLPARSSGRWLVREAGRYLLRVDVGRLDLLSFRDLVGQARAAAAGGDLSTAVDRYLEALGLWQGRCAEDLGAVVAIHPVFTTLDREYLAVVSEAATAALGCGRAGAVLPFIRQAADRCPLDEALQASLGLVLAADGKQAEAIMRFRDVRTRLVDELGVEPGSELRAAQERVLRGSPVSRAAVSAISSGPVPRAPHGAPWIVPAQLPPDLPCFTGREQALEQAWDAMHRAGEGSRILAIDGIPGVGKTALAVHFAHRAAKEFPDGQLYMDLGGFSSATQPMAPEDVLYGFLGALGVDRNEIPASPEARSALFRSALSGRRVLVVLDNVSDVNQVRPLLPGVTECMVVVTSRSRLLGLAAAHGARLLSLDLPSMAAATECFLRRVGSTHLDADAATVEEIVTWCGRLPLALAVVAARAVSRPEQSLSRLAAELAAAQGSLDGFDDFDGTNDLRSAFSWSCRRISAEAKRVFCLLPLHGTADITAAVLASLAGISWEAAATAAGELVGARLLDARERDRYGTHSLILAYAAELDGWSETGRRVALQRPQGYDRHSARYAA
ncbi:BTAD domain-containing putative transcriptional regulator [Streptomyces sp. VRA16 Mangrove soil]|uniref:AfsR/SARP family transcriptional regulator n=1 Tax=Streptomyces sp. VRA16 Mangrove soil TaxID=2817434 RepID=UPI001E3B3995|nr:BTAD domain-containing putative transcriptional regulator [Streptomyces sp. VRA16 Mangrove soil]